MAQASTHTGNWNSWADGFKKDSHLPRVGHKLTYYITPANPTMLNIIKRAVDEAKLSEDFPHNDANVLVLDSHEKAKKQDLCRIGDHPFQFYTTWMTSKEYKLIWSYHPTAENTLPLPYPNLNKQFRDLLQQIGIAKIKPEGCTSHLQWPLIGGEEFAKGSANGLAELCYPVVDFEVHITTEFLDIF